MQKTKKRILMEAYSLGVLSAGVSLTALLYPWQVAGVLAPPKLETRKFTVAIVAGPKQAAKTAPNAVLETAPEVQVVQTQAAAAPKVVTQERPSSLPNAVQAETAGQPSAEIAKQEEVIPPARVSMPGGHLAVEDQKIGEGVIPEIFAVAPNTVYLRLFVNEVGDVVRGGIVRSGGDAFRDRLVYKSLSSRKYNPSNIRLKVSDNPAIWQLDLEIPYGNDDFLP